MKTVIKIALGIVLGVVILLVGCGALLSSGSNSNGSDATTKQESSEVTKESEEASYPIVVEDNDMFSLEITDASYDSIFGETVKCKFTNKTNQNIAFNSDDAILNDKVTSNIFLYLESTANTSSSESFTIDTTDFDEFKDKPVDVTLKYEIHNTDSYDTIDEGKITFTINN